MGEYLANRIKEMIARISTLLQCTEDRLWRKLLEPKSLQYVASPVLSFAPAVKGALDGEWAEGKTYELNLYFLKVIPLGRHSIRLVTIDRERNAITSSESGLLAPVWNHSISFRQVGADRVSYTDEIEIRAGWLTPVIWLFAHLFYRHRQRRWKTLLKLIKASYP